MPSSRIHYIWMTLATLGALAPRAGAQAQAGPGEIVLRPGDAVRVEIKDEMLEVTDYVLDEAGRVLLPLVGLIDAAGRPFSEVRRELLDAYARELAEPVVVLTPLMRIAVLGEVRNPGLYQVDPTHTLGDVLAIAGGLTVEANAEEISLVRAGLVIDNELDFRVGALGAPLQSGDQIVVGRRSTLSQNVPIFLSAITSVAVAVVTSLIIR